jgi:hypothetical protein
LYRRSRSPLLVFIPDLRAGAIDKQNPVACYCRVLAKYLGQERAKSLLTKTILVRPLPRTPIEVAAVHAQLFDTLVRLGLSYEDKEEPFRRMVVNVMARNCDDHTKNFAFRLRKGLSWELAPGPRSRLDAVRAPTGKCFAMLNASRYLTCRY